jgi:hypothetical protein
LKKIEAQSVHTQPACLIEVGLPGDAAYFHKHAWGINPRSPEPFQATSRIATVRIHDFGTGLRVESEE